MFGFLGRSGLRDCGGEVIGGPWQAVDLPGGRVGAWRMLGLHRGEQLASTIHAVGKQNAVLLSTSVGRCEKVIDLLNESAEQGTSWRGKVFQQLRQGRS